MRTWLATAALFSRRMAMKMSAVVALVTVSAAAAFAQPEGETAGGEASLKLPDLSQVSFFNGAIDGHKLLLIGILFCLFGLGFGMAIFWRLKNLSCPPIDARNLGTDLRDLEDVPGDAGEFILLLWAFIVVIIAAYFGWLALVPGKPVGLTLPIILAFNWLASRQLWRGMVRHSSRHVRQLADGIRFPAEESLIPCIRFHSKQA